MAIICALCSKKQSSFIEDFPISPASNNVRVCAKCNDFLNDIKGCAESRDERYLHLRNEFQIIISNNSNISSECMSAITKIRQYCENVYYNYTVEEMANLEIKKKQEEDYIHQQLINNFMLTTGFNFESYSIVEYLKVITAETVLGTGFLSELSAGFSDFWGSKNALFADKLQKAKDYAMNDLIEKGLILGANAIIGVDFDYIIFSGNIIGIVINGTAVKIKKSD